jgi:uncharacterized protein YdeI (YjbR/CyaY-like superfamily)
LKEQPIMTVDSTHPLTVEDFAAWRAWLDEHEHSSDGVWVTLAKNGVTSPTSLSYAQALDEALCSGWIDGRRQAIDAARYRQHFTLALDVVETQCRPRRSLD